MAGHGIPHYQNDAGHDSVEIDLAEHECQFEQRIGLTDEAVVIKRRKFPWLRAKEHDLAHGRPHRLVFYRGRTATPGQEAKHLVSVETGVGGPCLEGFSERVPNPGTNCRRRLIIQTQGRPDLIVGQGDC